MPKRFSATNESTGEKISFEWNHPEPPTPDDIETIAGQQRTSRIAMRQKMQTDEDNKPFLDKVLQSKPVGALLNVTSGLGLNQPWHPVEGMTNVGSGMHELITGQGPEANPRTAGAVRAVHGAMQTMGPPMTAAGYALAPGVMAPAMAIAHGSGMVAQALTPDDYSPEVKDAISTGASLIGGGVAGHYASRMGAPEAPPMSMRGRGGSVVTQLPPRGLPQGEEGGPPQLPSAGPVPRPVPRQLPGPMGPPPNGNVIPFRGGPAPAEPPVTPTLPAAPQMKQLPQSGQPIQMPPASIPMPPAGTFDAQQAAQSRVAWGGDNLAPGAQRQLPPPSSLDKPVSSPSEVSTVQPPQAPDPVRSQGEQSPPPQAAAPAPAPLPPVEPPAPVPLQPPVKPPAPALPPAPPSAPPAMAQTPEVLPPVQPPAPQGIAARAMARAQPPIDVAPQAPPPTPAVIPPVAPPAPPTPPAPPPVAVAPQAPPAPPQAPPPQAPPLSIAQRAIQRSNNPSPIVPGPVRPPGFEAPAPVGPKLLDTISTGTKDPKLQGELKKFIKRYPDWTPEEAGQHLAQTMPSKGPAWKSYSPAAYIDYAKGVKQTLDEARAKITEVHEPPPEPTPASESEIAPAQQKQAVESNTVLDFLKKRVNVTPDQLQRTLGASKDDIMLVLRDLMKRGLINAKAGTYNYNRLPNEKAPLPDVPPPTAKVEPGPVAPINGAGNIKPPEVEAPAEPAEEPTSELSPREKKLDQMRQVWQEETDKGSSEALKSQYDNEAKNVQIEKSGTKPQKAILAELDNVSNRIDTLEDKDSNGTITREEAAELAQQYKELNRLEKKRDYALKPNVEKYGPRVANLMSVHAEGQLVGLDHEALSKMARAMFKVESMKELSPEQLTQFEDSLKTDRLGEEASKSAPEEDQGEEGEDVIKDTNARIDELETKEETHKLSADESKELKDLYKTLSKFEGQRGSISFRPKGTRRPTNEPSRFGTFLHKFNGIINSQDVFLEQNPQTRPVSEIIHNAQVRGDYFEHFWLRRYDSASDKGFVRQQLANFLESRGFGMEDIKPATEKGNLGFREFLHNVKTAVYDEPAATRAREIIKDIPEGFDKDRASWYVNNWTRADLRDSGQRFFKQLDSTAAQIGARSVLFGSTDLQALHMARLVSQVWPEVGTPHTLAGMAKFLSNPKAAWEEAASVGLMPQQKVPWSMKTATEKFDSVGNYLDFGNSVVKAIALQAMKAKYPEDTMKAIRETKRIEGVVGRESPVFAMEKTPKTVYQFKYWLFKYLGNIGTAARNGEMAKVGRYIVAATMLEEMTRRLGVKLYHLKPSTMFSGGSVTLRKLQNVTRDAVNKKWDKAGEEIGTSIPGGVSLLPTAKLLMEGEFKDAFHEFLPMEKAKAKP